MKKSDKRESKRNQKKTIGDIIRSIILAVAVGVFLYSGLQLYHIYSEYKKGADEYDQVRQYLTLPDTAGDDNLDQGGDPAKITVPQVDFEALRQINPDVVAWIQLDALDISYPVVKGTDNDRYLSYTFEGNKNSAGAIFMDYSNASDFNDCNTLIYGHNMKNGSMFGKLKKFQREDAYSKSPYFWICTPSGSYRYEIFSYHTTSATGDTYTMYSGPGEEFKAYLDNMQSMSEVSTQVQLTQDDKIVTLSTCTGNDATRFVVQGKRLPEVY